MSIKNRFWYSLCIYNFMKAINDELKKIKTPCFSLARLIGQLKKS